MRYIMMVLRGNMRRNKGVHISVFVLMLIISLAFCSVLSYYTNSIRHYICYDYFIGFPIKVLVDRAMCKKSILQIYCMEEKNEIHQNQ